MDHHCLARVDRVSEFSNHIIEPDRALHKQPTYRICARVVAGDGAEALHVGTDEFLCASAGQEGEGAEQWDGGRPGGEAGRAAEQVEQEASQQGNQQCKQQRCCQGEHHHSCQAANEGPSRVVRIHFTDCGYKLYELDLCTYL